MPNKKPIHLTAYQCAELGEMLEEYGFTTRWFEAPEIDWNNPKLSDVEEGTCMVAFVNTDNIDVGFFDSNVDLIELNNTIVNNIDKDYKSKLKVNGIDYEEIPTELLEEDIEAKLNYKPNKNRKV